MATQDDINRHDQLFISLSKAFRDQLEPRFVQVFDSIAAEDSPTRAQLLQLFQPLRESATQVGDQINQIVEDNIQLNQDVLGETLDPQTQGSIDRLNQEFSAALATQVEEEQNTIINELVLAAIAGGITASVLSSIRSSSSRALRRLELTFENTARQFDAALTYLRAENSSVEVRYRYVGGVIAESRQFCRQMNGRVFTEAQIRSTWSSQTWGGKRPGDPFVVRGGYNCRHSWVVEPEEE